MRSLARLISSVLILALSAACSIYPLSEDVTGFDNRHIVKITRCQARDAVRAEMLRALDFFNTQIVYGRMTGAEMAEWLRKDERNYYNWKISELGPVARRLYQFYADTSLSYDFTIDSTEMNGAALDLTLVKTLLRGSDTVGFSLKNDRTRQVKRQFRNYDSLDNLARNLPLEYCADIPTAENPIYPATGLTRIATLVRDFVDQNQKDNLGSKESALDAEMNDTIVFTTKFAGNIDPNFATPSITGRLIPTEIKFNSSNYRLDVHTIIVLIRLPDRRDRIVLFDGRGNISSIGRAAIDDRFREIRDNNFKDDFNKAVISLARVAP